MGELSENELESISDIPQETDSPTGSLDEELKDLEGPSEELSEDEFDEFDEANEELDGGPSEELSEDEFDEFDEANEELDGGPSEELSEDEFDEFDDFEI